MARISGVDIPGQKRGEIALTYIFGLGKSSAQKILDQAEVDRNKKKANTQCAYRLLFIFRYLVSNFDTPSLPHCADLKDFIFF